MELLEQGIEKGLIKFAKEGTEVMIFSENLVVSEIENPTKMKK